MIMMEMNNIMKNLMNFKIQQEKHPFKYNEEKKKKKQRNLFIIIKENNQLNLIMNNPIQNK